MMEVDEEKVGDGSFGKANDGPRLEDKRELVSVFLKSKVRLLRQ